MISSNTHTNSGNSKFDGRIKYECALKKIALSHDGEDNQLKKFTVGLQALANKLKLPKLCKSIENMIMIEMLKRGLHISQSYLFRIVKLCQFPPCGVVVEHCIILNTDIKTK